VSPILAGRFNTLFWKPHPEAEDLREFNRFDAPGHALVFADFNACNVFPKADRVTPVEISQSVIKTESEHALMLAM
jgi:hypothetical protein